jgi:hypothetical protein
MSLIEKTAAALNDDIVALMLLASLLMMPVLCSPVCEWLLCLAVFQAC